MKNKVKNIRYWGLVFLIFLGVLILDLELFDRPVEVLILLVGMISWAVVSIWDEEREKDRIMRGFKFNRRK